MAEYLIQSETLDDIADAINAKTGGASAMTPAQMVTEIGNIQSGGGIADIDCQLVAEADFVVPEATSAAQEIRVSYNDSAQFITGPHMPFLVEFEYTGSTSENPPVLSLIKKWYLISCHANYYYYIVPWGKWGKLITDNGGINYTQVGYGANSAVSDLLGLIYLRGTGANIKLAAASTNGRVWPGNWHMKVYMLSM